MDHIKGIIWDLDHTLYRVSDQMCGTYDYVMGRAAVENGAPLDVQAAFELAARSYKETGMAQRYFLDMYPEIEEDALLDSFHEFLDEKLIEPFPRLPAQFESTHDTQHIIMTHGVREWVNRVLKHIGLSEHFDDDHIFDFNDIGRVSKKENKAGFNIMLDYLGLHPRTLMMVEDKVENLRIAKDLGVTTILVTYGKPPQPMPPYVDFAFDTAEDVMDFYLACKKTPGPKYEPPKNEQSSGGFFNKPK